MWNVQAKPVDVTCFNVLVGQRINIEDTPFPWAISGDTPQPSVNIRGCGATVNGEWQHRMCHQEKAILLCLRGG